MLGQGQFCDTKLKIVKMESNLHDSLPPNSYNPIPFLKETKAKPQLKQMN